MSEQGLTKLDNRKGLLESDESSTSRVILNNAKRHQSQYCDVLGQMDKVPSINESFNNRGNSPDNQDEESKDNNNFLQPAERSSKTLRLEDDDESDNRSSPRVNMRGTTGFEVMNDKLRSDTLDSNHESFNIHPSNSKQLPNGRSSSSLVSSSKTSVGFLKDFYYQLVELIKYRNCDQLRQELQDNDDVYGPVDMSKKILLHYACEFNSIDICKIIFECLFYANPDRTNINPKEWINRTNNDGLSPIHFAAYRGNNELIAYLITQGADVYATDKDGHNCIHIAAQSDKINTIYFLLKNYKFDINQGDKKLSTALHWSAFLNKENALTYLLAWGADPNLQDIDNNTPLHLSVILSCRTNNTRNVKLLLLKGASRDVTNNDQYKPIDLVNSDVQKAGELKQLLSKSKFLSCFMLRPPLSKLRKNERTVVFFLVLLFAMIMLTYFYIIPTYESIAIPIVCGVFAFFILITFTVVTLKDPGYLMKSPDVDFQELLNTLDPLDICPECEIILTPRCRHCNICNRCVERFDHHCPYINNCVGYNNHFAFLLYIVSLGINLVLHLALAIIALILHENKGEALFDVLDSVTMFYVSCSFVILVTGVFVLPVLFLVFVHCTNFAKNKTTNERFSKQKINNTSLTTKMNNSVDRGDGNTSSILVGVEFNSFMGVQNSSCFANCLSMCDYRPPSQTDLHSEIMRED